MGFAINTITVLLTRVQENAEKKTSCDWGPLQCVKIGKETGPKDSLPQRGKGFLG